MTSWNKDIKVQSVFYLGKSPIRAIGTYQQLSPYLIYCTDGSVLRITGLKPNAKRCFAKVTWHEATINTIYVMLK